MRSKRLGQRRQDLRSAAALSSYLSEPLEPRVLLSGITIITHGFNDNATDPTGWVQQMADAISAQPGQPLDKIIYTVTVKDPQHPAVGTAPATDPLQVTSVDEQSGPPLQQTQNPEIVILLDWSDVAGQLLNGRFLGYVRSTADVAEAFVSAMLQPGFLPGIQTPITELPIHLIGHSRGGSLVSEISKDLAEHDIWVDQQTTLDSHPLTQGEFLSPISDPIPQVYDNTIFADNYFQTLNYPEGYFVDGATGKGAGQLLDAMLQNDGLPDDSTLEPGTLGADHNQVHSWYYGTIDKNYLPTYTYTSDSLAAVTTVVARSSWYGTGDIGYDYSNVRSGQSLRQTDGAAGLLWAGATRSSGYQHLGLQWPNVDLDPTAASTAFVAGQTLPVSLRYEDWGNASDLVLFLDTNQNPYDGFLPGDQGNVVGPDSTTRPYARAYASFGTSYSPVRLTGSTALPLDTNGVAGGTYYLCAEIKDNNYRRFEYLPEPIRLVNPADRISPTAVLADPANGATIGQSTLNSRQWIWVRFDDQGGSGLNASTLTDGVAKFTISGPGVGTASFSPTPSATSDPSVYRFAFTGSFGTGSVTLNFTPGTWADKAGNLNAAASATFNVVTQPVISSVSPATLPPLTTPQTLTVNGANFNPSSFIALVDPNGMPTKETTTYISSSQLSCSVTTTAQGQWTVRVVNSDGTASNAQPLFVSGNLAVATPVISPDGGLYNSGITVSITDSTPGATIRYTLDGSDPTATSDVYTWAFTLGSSATVKAAAFAPGDPPSGIASAAYAINTPQPSLYVSASRIVMPYSTQQESSAFLVYNAVPNSGTMNFTMSTNDSWITFPVSGSWSSGPTVTNHMTVNVAPFTGPGGRVGTVTVSAPGALNSPQSVTIVEGADPYSTRDIAAGSVFLTSSPNGGPIVTNPQVGQTVYVNFTADLIADPSNLFNGGVVYYVSQNNDSDYDFGVQNQLPGSGIITVTDPKAWTIAPGNNTFTVSIDTGDVFDEFNLDNNSAAVTVSALAPPSIVGSVFLDVNVNGVWDSNEPGLAGSTVYLDENGNGQLDPGEPTAYVSDATGQYSFQNVAPGTYIVRDFLQPNFGESTPLGYSGVVQVTSGQTASGPVFGEVNPSAVTLNLQYLLMLTRNFGKPGTLASGDLNADGMVDLSDFQYLARNFGGMLAGTVSGRVFNDVNDNGQLDSGEVGLAGALVYMDANNNGKLDNGEFTAFVDNSGNYTFYQVLPGTYTVREVAPTGYSQTSPSGLSARVTVYPSRDSAGPVFGNVLISSLRANMSYFMAMARNFGQPGTIASGDLNGDGTVNLADLLLLTRNFGHALPTTTSAIAAPAGSASVPGVAKRRV